MQDLNDKITGNTLTASEWNQVPSEIQNVIEGLGIALSGADLNQLGKAIAGYVANGSFYTDSGIADAYVLTAIGSKKSPVAYTEGMLISFIAGNDNTGTATVNVAGLGVKDLRDPGGAVLTANSFGTVMAAQFIYNVSAGHFRMLRPVSPNVQSFTVNGTWTKPAGFAPTTKVIIEGWSGGGSGFAGVTGSGGGGGSYVRREYLLSQFAATEAVGIGAGGAASVGAGNQGGNTTVGALFTAYGGAGGNSTTRGGGGGGETSAGSGYTAGGPSYSALRKGGVGGGGEVASAGGSADSGGGGGGSTGYVGGASIYGGGGGGGSGAGYAGGNSSYGGDGGAGSGASPSNGVDGSIPGGGGGGSADGTSGAGARGEVTITVL